MGFIPSARTDLVEKRKASLLACFSFFWLGHRDSEPFHKSASGFGVGVQINQYSSQKDRATLSCCSVFLAGAQGFEPRKCQSQSLMPYRLAMPQNIPLVLTTYVLYQKEIGLSIAFSKKFKNLFRLLSDYPPKIQPVCSKTVKFVKIHHQNRGKTSLLRHKSATIYHKFTFTLFFRYIFKFKYDRIKNGCIRTLTKTVNLTFP